jgi:hypothetical protein
VQWPVPEPVFLVWVDTTHYHTESRLYFTVQ